MADCIECLGMACADASCHFRPIRFKRRGLGDHDLLIDMKYCGVCHSDSVWLKGESGMLTGTPVFPDALPGHELAGIVAQVGKNVTKFKVGDQVGVGNMVDSCLQCEPCRTDAECLCENKYTATYGGKDKHGRAGIVDGSTRTKGGFCNKFVVHEHFAISIPSTYPLEAAGPMMCAGSTVYTAMKDNNVGPDVSVGIVGLGGLGMTAIKIATILGAQVTAISRNDRKRQFALDAGASHYVATADANQMRQALGSMDVILNTIPSSHDYDIYNPFLKANGRQVLLGLTDAFAAAYVLRKPTCFGYNCRMRMSPFGGLKNTQELIDLADKHRMIPRTEIRPVSDLNRIVELCEAGNDDGLRYVLDIGNTLTEEAFDKISCGPAPKLVEPHPLSTAGVVTEVVKMRFSQMVKQKRAARK